MSGIFSRAVEGQPLRIPAQAYNAAMDAAEHFATRGRPTGGGPIGGTKDAHRLVVNVRNNTGENIDAFEAFCVDHNQTGQSGQLTITDNEYSVGEAPVLCIGQVNRETGPVHLVVTLEPIPSGEIGRAVIRGVCIAKVDFVSADHTYADLPNTGSILVSGYGGRVRIIQREVTGGDSDHCLVDLIQSPVGSQMVYISAGPTSGLYTGYYYEQNFNSPYNQTTTGIEVRAIPIGGGTLQTGRVYFGTTLGTVTVSGTPYDLVSLVGDANHTAVNGSGYPTAWAGGLVNTTTQTIKGVKTFNNIIYVRDDVTYPGALVNVSPTGALTLSTDSYGGFVVTTQNGPEVTLSATHGSYTPTGYLTIYDDPSNTDYNLYLSSGGSTPTGYTGVLISDKVGVVQSSTVYWGSTQTVSIAYKNQSGNNETTSLVFIGGLLISSSVTNP